MKPKLRLDTPENYKKRQREYDEEVRVWEEANRPSITTLKAKLFAIGGDRISPQPCPYIEFLASSGQLINLPIKLRKMAGNHCHDNINNLWEQRKEGSELKGIITGYGLSADGMWRPHSWGCAPNSAPYGVRTQQPNSEINVSNDPALDVRFSDSN